ncbi:MAG: hypothetical protein ACRD3H_03985 [Terriglobales bacterium]
MENHTPMVRTILLLLAVAASATMTPQAKAQSISNAAEPSSTAVPSAGAAVPYPDLTYIRPSQKTKLRNYFFDAFGPYPIVGASLAAGINQADRTPPEWKQGAEGYGKRFASNFAIAAVSTTTRYALAQAFHEDTLYYRCDCKGFFPRLGHATISTFSARRGDDGHRVFSFPSVVAPYVGTMTAVYAWFPGRYGVQDGFRMGNYSLLGYVGENVAREFLYGGPNSLSSRVFTHRHETGK